MQSKQSPVLRLSVIAVAAHLTALAAGAAFAQETTEQTAAKPGKAEVVITGKKLGMGLMVTEDAPKARSTITAEELEKQRPTGNAYQALEMLPAVNSYNYDATGLFGGGLTLRGFNSDQIGATINGVPVNDSGNFAVYPQEYVDQENTCSEFVTQGSTDVDSPQVGATGGNFGITTCAPEKTRRVRAMQTFGQLNMRKSFVRYDTGAMLDGKFTAFISGSHAESDKWKGKGGADRNHIDFGANYDWDRFNYIHATILYNKAVNNNIYNPTLSELKANGYYFDYADTFKGHLTPVKGTAQTETTQSPVAYYGLSVNPFKNIIASAVSKFRLSENLDVAFTPYMWYGFGNGGTQQRAQSEKGFYNPATGKRDQTVDLNGDGDTLDTVLVASASVTRTVRPGANLAFIYTTDNHEIKTGVWWERARHEQTGPMLALTNDGNRADIWLQDGQILRPDGHPANARDWISISTAYQAFAQDTISLMDDKVKINIGVRTPYIKRDFTNFGDENNTVKPFQFSKTYNEVLPQLGARYRVTNDDQIFASVAKNMKAPPNFIFGNVGSNVVVDATTLNPVSFKDTQPETSWSGDLGYRHQDSKFIASVTAFYTDFKNKQASSFDPETAKNTYLNIGAEKHSGLEVELGNTPINGWAFYGSLGLLKTELKDNQYGFAGTTRVLLPTAGKDAPNAPRRKAGLSVEYQDGPFWMRAKARATSKQYASLLNDEVAPGYTVFDLDGGYTFPNFGGLKRPKLTFNVSNLTSKQFRNPSSTTVINAQSYQGVAASSVARYYMAAPRFASATLSVDF
ncbi:iron complex outermembrane receptor protein [Duganella sp. 1224]|uniref:TonB-dependent receptor n=1 Tax=Duganella sp. 1224 TaxID=2587052 RepID=UPI0015CDBFFF|nr:TonB-dependent receptor [Duganella sp. 1224]NYE63689.1 iron complex outermembrane receptor protein [Duganella sp. 1224]